MTCAICGIRKPKRYCPGVKGDICTVCCGVGREETVDCPLACEYLQDAHRHEKPNEVDPETVPNGDMYLPESFLEANEWLLIVLGSAVMDAARTRDSITDYDLREAFDSLVRSWRAQEAGLVYDTPPVNPYAAAVFEAVRTRVADLRKRAADSGATATLKDSSVLRMLVFMQRLEYLHNNGRKRSRAFLDFLSQFFTAQEASPLEIDEPVDEPRIIL